ncbi:TetR-like C-terminal domain-containing protein [Frankia sp. AgPm24]|uniref:TetR-like C-terminal domain-containing protein n=1 Tax=Frankia sp. AgPm24 TaxID=631128 RepID=UPI00200C47D2|nr:TetR-like C-terminal domain-containing protein [Frankia sp. AgPm24]
MPTTCTPRFSWDDPSGRVCAADCFNTLTGQLRQIHGSSPEEHLAGLGRSYIDFGLANPALFDLMFRPSELRPEDPVLQTARASALGILGSAVRHLTPTEPAPRDVPALALISWALVHGLVTLSRNGSLRSAAATGAADADDANTDDTDDAEPARRLGDLFSAYLARVLAGEPPRPTP